MEKSLIEFFLSGNGLKNPGSDPRIMSFTLLDFNFFEWTDLIIQLIDYITKGVTSFINIRNRVKMIPIIIV